MSVTELEKIIPVPKPRNGEELSSIIDNVEKWLGCVLPEDYKELTFEYGSGEFCDGFLLFVCPDNFDRYVEFVTYHQNLFWRSVDSGSRKPDSQTLGNPVRLLPWGSDENGHHFHFLMNGPPECWSILLESHEGEFEKADFSISEFLVKSFRNQFRPKHIWYQLFSESELNLKRLGKNIQ